uniref:F-box domain-containing protein n=1 Tax=Leersia perrieri TaxID=77586 RepID=A0A0D9XQ90_9ORYZ
MAHRGKAPAAPDRIGALPDEVLHLVLSLLPAHEAVRTRVLARRWRHLWKESPRLSVEYEEGSDHDNYWFLDLVDCLLSLRNRDARLEYCCFRLFFWSPYVPERRQYVVPWIREVLRCQVQVLEIYLGEEPAVLPELRFISQHLTTLHLAFLIIDDKLLELSDCPALVDLEISRCNIYVARMSSRSLKCLRIDSCDLSYHRIQISFPSLVTLQIRCCEGFRSLKACRPWKRQLLNMMTNLRTLVMNMTLVAIIVKAVLTVLTLELTLPVACLKGLSAARHLELLAVPTMIIFRRDLKLYFACHTFSKLKTLLLNEWCVIPDPSALICFLQHSPILEKLTIQISKKPKSLKDSEGQYNTSEQPFASNHIRIVKIECEEVNTLVCKILKTLIMYGIPLEKINIKQTIKQQGKECFTFRGDYEM